MTWTMVMSQRYPPGSLKFERPEDVASNIAFQTAAIGWENALTGKALKRFRGDMISPELSRKLREFSAAQKKLGIR